MRTAFIDVLSELAEADERVWLACGDLGYSVLENFADRFPERYINVGVAEQNMTGVAAGLAHGGKVVFTYSIANFPVTRCLEQIRNDLCYHNLNVKVVAVGGGLTYGSAGYTHHGVEDLALMRSLPNMTVLAPADPIEARAATRAAAELDGPCYLRLGRAGEAILHETTIDFQIGTAILVHDGDDVTLITTGGMLGPALEARAQLEATGISTRVVSMPCIAPFDGDAVRAAARVTGAVLSIEEHGVGGLGSAVAEVLAEDPTPCRFKVMRLRREAIKTAGSQVELRSAQGLSAEGIAEQVRLLLSPNGEA